MKKTCLFTVTREEGRENSGLFYTWGDYHAATFSPELEIINVIPLVIHGKTYRERKANLRDLAVEVQSADVGGLSWGELADLQDFFQTNGRRYGLLSEFREEAIC